MPAFVKNSNQASANQLLQKGEIDLDKALKFLVNGNQELDVNYLDEKLISTMKSGWPLDKAVPVLFANKKLYIATVEEPTERFQKTLSEMVNNCPVELLKISSSGWNNWIRTLTGGGPVEKGTKAKSQLGAALLASLDSIPVRKVKATDENSIGNDVRAVMDEANKIGASDIHYEPTEKFLIVRFRIDGVLRDVYKYECRPKEDFRKIILARIKIIANLNIAEARKPQDGRITENLAGKKVDLRISTLPVLYGEKCVIRLLPHDLSFSELTDLGMELKKGEEFESWLHRTQGMVLVTGPTGSGKTSTLYTSLAKVLDITKNVVTVEDPVEYQLARVNQVQVNSKAGLTFSAGLRSILRQDPDIVMIGEIRDTETVEIAIQAALTGHLVLSTLHTNDAPSTISRLIDMGAQPYLISSALIGVLAQRLLRRVCVHCGEDYKPTEKELGTLDLKADQDYTFKKANGCEACNYSGYLGREGIFEVMPVTDKMKLMIQEGAGMNEYKKYLKEAGIDSLFDAGVKKVVERISTTEELLRVVPKGVG